MIAQKHHLALQTLFANNSNLAADAAEILIDICNVISVGAGEFLAEQGEIATTELVLLSGQIACSISNSDGLSVCCELSEGPTILPPNISRIREGKSIYDIEVLKTAYVATIEANCLMENMVENPNIRDWGNEIMRDQLMRQSERQWALAALDAKSRLEWLREKHPLVEDKFDHWRIASYLGMTPVTLSRVRKQLAANYLGR